MFGTEPCPLLRSGSRSYGSECELHPYGNMTPAPSLVRQPLRLAGRVVSDPGLLRSTAIVFLGDASARMLGFLFSVAAARLLTPAGYGQIAYALAATPGAGAASFPLLSVIAVSIAIPRD